MSVVEFDPMIEYLKGLMTTHYAIPEDGTIMEMGSEAFVDFDVSLLPMGMIETVGDIDGAIGGELAVNDLYMDVRLRLWLIRRPDPGSEAEKDIRNDHLLPMVTTLKADRRLGWTIQSPLKFNGMGYVPTSEWPIEIEPGSGIQAGHVDITCRLVGQ